MSVENFRSLIQVMLISLCMAFSFVAQAADAVGKVIKVEGSVVARDNAGKSRALARGDDLFVQETIKTDAKGSIVMRYLDGTVVELQPDSEYIVHAFDYAESAPHSDNYAAELIKGGFRSITGKIGSRSPAAFETKARETTLTVRGTEFEGFLPNCVPTQNKNNQVCLDCSWHVSTGSVEVNFQGNSSLLVAGTNTAGYSLIDGRILLTKAAPQGTGAGAYNNQSLSNAVPTAITTTTTVTNSGTTVTSGAAGSGGPNPCGELDAIGAALHK